MDPQECSRTGALAVKRVVNNIHDIFMIRVLTFDAHLYLLVFLITFYDYVNLFSKTWYNEYNGSHYILSQNTDSKKKGSVKREKNFFKSLKREK